MSMTFRTALLTILFLAQLVGPPAASADGERSVRTAANVASNVVKLKVYSNGPDLTSPWQKLGVSTASGSGVILDDQRILTNAHVVENAVNIEVLRAGKSKTYTARVEFIGHDCDLALVRVDDPRFFEGAAGISFGEMPGIQDEVQVHGFPVGGETVSVTSGIVSRIEVDTYSHSFEDLLIAQIDAPLNPGNSGGPVLSNGSIVGIASQMLGDAENVGYMIPLPVIKHFLDDLADGDYGGFPIFGVKLQSLENTGQRASLGMGDEQTGVLVVRVDHGSPAAAVLQTKDVLLAIDGHPISNEGTVALPGFGQIQHSETFRSQQIGEQLNLDVLRDGKSISLRTELTPHRALIPFRGPDNAAEYLTFAGLVFQPLSLQYLLVFEEIPADLQNLAFHQNIVTPERSQMILIQKVLPHAINRGYQEWEDYIVHTLNGRIPRDMKQLAEMIDGAEGRWLEIVTMNGSILTLDLAEARAAQASILATFGITKDRSQGLVAADN